MNELDLNKKEKDRGKNALEAIGCLFILVFYFDLLRTGNSVQRIRMLLSWVLYFVTIRFDPGKIPSLLEYSGTYEEYLAKQSQNETLFPIFGAIWFFFVIISWILRANEEKSK